MVQEINELFSKIKTHVKEYIPLTAEIDVTYRCPCACVHCYQENIRRKDMKELSFEEIINLIDDLYELGTIECVVSGGDPFCRKDIWKILSYLKGKGIRTIVFTSGILLKDEECKRLSELDIARVEMTLLGIDRETHDRLSRKSGAYDSIIEVINSLKKYNVPMRLKYMLLHENYKSNVEIKEKLGDEIDICHYLWCKQGGKESEIKKLRITEDELKKFYVETGISVASKERAILSCNAGKYKIAIDADGSVKPCGAFANSYLIGNIRDSSIKTIWYKNEELKKMREQIRYPVAQCRKCNMNQYCLMCPAIVTWEKGDIGGIYTAVCKYAQVAMEVDNGYL